MFSISPTLAAYVPAASADWQKQIDAVQQMAEAKANEPPQEDWLAGVIVGDANTDDFIYNATGKLPGSSSVEQSSPDFWVKETTTSYDHSDGSVTPPWERTWATQEDFIDGLHDYLRSKIKQPKTAAEIEASRQAHHLADGVPYEPKSTTATDAKMAAMKNAEVQDQVPKRAKDLIMWTSALNNMIDLTKSAQYQTDEKYKNRIDGFIDRFKDMVTAAHSYLTRNADIKGTLIQANDDGTYTNPAFTISYQGQVLYNHADD